jgi:hypothetical protein
MSKRRTMSGPHWEVCCSPERMVGVLTEQSSVRKLRLLACAIVRCAPFHPDGRTIWDLLPTFDWFKGLQLIDGTRPDCRGIIAIAEKFADGQAGGEEWEAACDQARYVRWASEADTFRIDAARYAGSTFRYAASGAVEHATEGDPVRLGRFMVHYRWYLRRRWKELHRENSSYVCRLIRDVFGNPFRPMTVDPTWRAWNDGTVKKLAQAIYNDRRFIDLPILADALEDAGCTDADILSHCRGPGPHVRGCWVVDRLLGKE